MRRFLKNEQGAALISVMMLVSLISVAAVASFHLLNNSIQQTGRISRISQLQEVALMAEQGAIEQVANLQKAGQLMDKLGRHGGVYEIDMPVADGQLKGSVADQTNCFNLNALVRYSDQGLYEMNEAVFNQFQAFLRAYGIGEVEALSLATALVDWQDSDQRSLPMGAEDATYAVGEVPYGTANAPLSDLSELRLVRGFTPALIEVIGPNVCLDRDLTFSLNVNRLTLEQAPLLMAVLGDGVNHHMAQGLIAARPAAGYDHISQFWQQQALKELDIPQQVRSQLGLVSDRFLLRVAVVKNQLKQAIHSVMKLGQDGNSRVISRWIEG